MITVSIFFYFLFLLLLVTGFSTTREFLYLICTHTKYTSKLASTAMVYLPLVVTVLNIEKYYFEHRVVTMM